MPRKTRPEKGDKRGSRSRSAYGETRTPRPKPKIDFTVDALDYKKAMLVFYERNNLSPMKEIFIEQAEFAVNTYF